MLLYNQYNTMLNSHRSRDLTAWVQLPTLYELTMWLGVYYLSVLGFSLVTYEMKLFSLET